MRKRLDVKKLENAQLKQCKRELINRFEALNHSEDEDTEATCYKIKGIYLETAENILAFREMKQKRLDVRKKHGQKFRNEKI
jgi:endonuclease III-like uncharacterized protein